MTRERFRWTFLSLILPLLVCMALVEVNGFSRNYLGVTPDPFLGFIAASLFSETRDRRAFAVALSVGILTDVLFTEPLGVQLFCSISLFALGRGVLRKREEEPWLGVLWRFPLFWLVHLLMTKFMPCFLLTFLGSGQPSFQRILLEAVRQLPSQFVSLLGYSGWLFVIRRRSGEVGDSPYQEGELIR